MPNVTPPGNAPETNVVTLSDFTGGLNLLSDNFKLAPNETPYVRNMDFSERGGIKRRRAWVEAVAVSGARNYQVLTDDVTGVTHVVFQDDAADELYYWDGAGGAVQLLRDASVPGAGQTDVVQDAAVASDTGWTADYMYWATFDGMGYGTRGWQATPQTSLKYDIAGVSTDTLTSITQMTDPAASAWQNDYDTPSGAHMPKARYVAAHNSMLWVAYTDEGGTGYSSRVRWSHPNDPGSWRENDFIDINPRSDDGAITGIMPFKEHLVVFKEAAVYVVFGYSPDTFQVVKVATHVGAVHQSAVCASEYGVFFYDKNKGVQLWDGNTVSWLFEKLVPAIESGDIEQPEKTRLAYLNHRLWCGVRWNDSGNADAGRMFIWDPKINGWTMYTGFDVPGSTNPNNHMNGGFELGPSDQTPYIALGYTFGTPVDSICEVDVADTFQDSVLGGAFTFTTRAQYQTPWIDLGDPAREKRWRRPEFIVSGGFDQSFTVRIFKDWDGSNAFKSLTLSTPAVAGASLWGTAVWGTDSWSTVVDLYHEVLRGGAIGATSRTLAFLFEAPTTVHEWHLDAYMIKWRNKRLKG